MNHEFRRKGMTTTNNFWGNVISVRRFRSARATDKPRLKLLVDSLDKTVGL